MALLPKQGAPYRLLVVLFLVLAFHLPACAGKHHQPWSSQDLFLGSVGVVVHGADWGTTRQMPLSDYEINGKKYWEINPLMGRHPTVQEVDAYMAVSLFTKIFVTDFLDPKYRPWWQGLWIAVGVVCVKNNIDQGLRVEF